MQISSENGLHLSPAKVSYRTNGALNRSYLNSKLLLDFFLQVIAGSSLAHFHKDPTVCFIEGPVPAADTPQFMEKDPEGLWDAHGH